MTLLDKIGGAPALALAPMQDVTDLLFWRLMARYGGPDVFFTEYFRVHVTSTLDKDIVQSITERPENRPVIAQMIGNDIPSLVRSARQLQQLPIIAVDLNLGCPAPVVYRKCAGGGLLRHPEKVDAILGALRDAVSIHFTVKTRIGFDSPDIFERLLPIFAKHSLDLLTVHGRTVQEMYRSEVHYEYIARAAAVLPCPVMANGNIYSAAKAVQVLKETGSQGLMIGRGAIRNPWIFRQIRERLSSKSEFVPCGRDVLEYLEELYHSLKLPDHREKAHVQRMKKYVNFVGLGIEPTGQFLHEIRRMETEAEFFKICRDFIDPDRLMPLHPYALDLKETDILAGEHR